MVRDPFDKGPRNQQVSEETVMQTKNLQEYAVFNSQDERVIDEDSIDNVLDLEKIESGATQKPTRNVRKSIEHFL